MPTDYTLWRRLFTPEEKPSLPCPRCARGVVVPDESSYRLVEPSFSKRANKHEDWEPRWDVYRFTMLMRCAVPECGEIVAVAGDADTDIYVDENNDLIAGPILQPSSMTPAPPLIRVPPETPWDVKLHIQKAFELYWMDLGASANRLRVGVETLLDNFKIPRQGVSASGSKPKRLDLFERIEAFKAHAPDHAETLDALRHVGNVGSHEGNIEQEVLLDAFSILEHAVSELYGKNSEVIDAMRKKIIKGKGKYKP